MIPWHLSSFACVGEKSIRKNKGAKSAKSRCDAEDRRALARRGHEGKAGRRLYAARDRPMGFPYRYVPTPNLLRSYLAPGSSLLCRVYTCACD